MFVAAPFPASARPPVLVWFRTLALAAVWLVGAACAADEPASALVAVPLAAPSAPRGATLFTALPPAQTGIVTENRFADPEMWGARYQEFALGDVGTGVTIGDYDNDGRPDLFVVSKTEGCRLFRNLGDWKFEDVTARAGLAMDPAAAKIWKQGATFVDVDNDGWLDLYLCRFNAPNLLFMNQHDGTFRDEAAARGLAVVDASGMAAFCDYDRDGWLDVHLQTSMLDGTAHPEGQPDYLFHNNGDGTFTDVTARAGITGRTLAHAGSWWDYDNDGWPDLYIANDFAHPDTLYRNQHDGTFAEVLDHTVPYAPYSSMGADVGDVNNDGLIDLIATDMAATTCEKDQRGMASSRALAHDANDSPAAPQYPRNTLFLNTGTGLCLEAAHLAGLAATDWTWSIRLEDLDNDGRLDVHITNGMNREYQNADLRDRMILAESPTERTRLIRASPVLAETHLAFRNRGDLQFEDVSASWGLDQKGVSFGAAFADFDGDGDLDLVYSNYQGGVTVLRNDSATGHRLIVALRGLSTSLKAPSLSRGTQSNRFGIGAVVHLETASGPQVRNLVLARGYLSSSEPVLHFGLGDDTVIRRLTVDWPSGQSQTFTNLSVDQKLTITEPSSTSDTVGAALRRDISPDSQHESAPTANPAPPRPPGQFAEISRTAGLELTVHEPWSGDGIQQPLLPFRLNHRGPAAAVGDLDGDGNDDLVLGGTVEDPTRVLLATGTTGSFATLDAAALATGSSLDDGPILLFDANGDGTNDLLVTKSGVGLPADSPEYQPRLFLNQGHATFRPAPADTLPPLSISIGAAAAVDFDRDGHLDLFLGGRVVPRKYPLPARSALLANRDGKFVDVTAELAPGLAQPGLVTSVLWSDADGDGWPDLLLALEWGGVQYWHNDAGRGFSDWSERAGFAAAGSGWWTSLASADFNGDGRPDFAAGNLGLNTQYRASPEHPALLFYGAFGDTSEPLLIEARYEGERLYPWRTRSHLAERIPSLRKRYPRNDAYARATLPEIFGEARLAAARRFAATEFQSGVFLSQPDGTWRFTPLPRLAQIAPFQGLVAGDFDGDGCVDLYTVQNSFAPIPCVGRHAGGLSQLLRGDGHGHFTPAPPAETDLLVTGDAKALVVLDLDRDGWPDFFVTRNNSTTLAYRNRGLAGRHSLRISLHGPTGNPTAIGARLRLEMTDGTTQFAEVAAGSGYYSQSTATSFFGYVTANPPQRLLVRWPGGATSEHLVSPGATELSFSAP